MIEDFQTERTDYASFAGRAALVGGTAYAGYSTFNEMKANRAVNPANKNQRADIGRLRNIRGVTQRDKGLATNPSFSDVLGNTREMRKMQSLQYNPGGKELTPNMIASMGFKSKGQLVGSLETFQQQLKDQGFSGVGVQYKQVGNHIGEIRIKGRYGGRMTYFKLNPVGADGTAYMGDNLQNKFVARGILDNSKPGMNVIDSDVALLRKYGSEIDNIKRGVINPHDLYKKIQDTILFEENSNGVTGINNAVGLLRKEQVVIDPFGEMSAVGRAATMKNIQSSHGWRAGSAAQAAKGILNSPESILNKMVPGSEISPTAYQLIRPSSFDDSVKPKVDWFGGENVGVGEFGYAHVKDKKALDEALSHMGYKVGELADEEMLMNKSRNFTVKNQIYNSKIDLDMMTTPSSVGLLNKVQSKLGIGSSQELGRILSSPEGLASLGPDALGKLDFDINEDYRKLLDTKSDLVRKHFEIQKMPGLSREDRDIARSNFRDEIRNTRRAIQEYEAFGVSADMANTAKLPAKELHNRIMNMSVDSNNNLSIAMQSQYRFGVGSKSFGAAKSTVKAEVDTAAVLAQMEFKKVFGRFGNAEEIESLLPDFADVDFIGMESPVKVVGEAMEARRMPSAISGYISTAVAEGRTDELARLGVTQQDGKFSLGEKDPRKLIQSIQNENPGKSMCYIFGGTRRGAADINISRTLLSTDIHAAQAGIGQTGTVTERGMYYLESLGLNEVTDDIYGRAMRGSDVFEQIKTLEDAKRIEKTVGVDQLITESVLNPNGESSLFTPNLDDRSRIIAKMGGEGTLMVDLGREIEGVRKVPVFSQQALAPYIGPQIGADDSITALDRATQDLLQSVAQGGVSEEALAAKVLKYRKAYESVQESLSAAIGKTKVKGSMYGQAVSSLIGMENAGIKLGKKMGLPEGAIAPIIAMSKDDIRMHFGKKGLEKANKGDLFGLVTREPIEGVHSVMPAQIRTAESFSAGKIGDELGDMSGRIFVGNSPMMRKSLGVDFDKDTLNVIAVEGDAAQDQLKAFMGLGNQQSDMGKEFYKSIQRMQFLDPKGGKTPVDALSTLDSDLSGIISAQKQLEKGAIGTFSNEFKNIHVGLREQLAQGGNASSYFKGEDFAHVFVENILKSKHQSKEALMKGEAMETLDLLNSKGKYARATLDERAIRMQEIFDQLSYSTTQEAKTVREAGVLALKTDKSMAEFGMGDMFNSIDSTDSLKSKAFAEVTDLDNIKNVLKAHSAGAEIAQQGDYIYDAMAEAKRSSKLVGAIDEAAFTAKTFMKGTAAKALKYAIAPAAIIGFASSVFSSPNVISKGSANHDVTNAQPETIDAGKTIFAIPQSKVDNVLIKGRANANTDFSSLQMMGASSGGNYNASVTDMRSKPDKHRIKEMIDRGY